MPKPILTQEFVKSRFKYENGRLFRKSRDIENRWNNVWNARFAGKECNTVSSAGYFVVSLYINGNPYLYTVHRIIFLMHHGYMPVETDHIDGNRVNNNIENLRNVSRQENRRNMKLAKNNSSGFTGVTFKPRSKIWEAYIGVNGKLTYLGSYKDKQEAIDARKKANIEHGYHANHGRLE